MRRGGSQTPADAIGARGGEGRQRRQGSELGAQAGAQPFAGGSSRGAVWRGITQAPCRRGATQPVPAADKHHATAPARQSHAHWIQVRHAALIPTSASLNHGTRC